jgi:hypothetical protein
VQQWREIKLYMPCVHTCAVGYWAAVGDVVVVKETLIELELPYKQVDHVKLGTRHWWFEIGPPLMVALLLETRVVD